MVAELGLLFDFGLVLVAGTVFGFLARELKQPLLVGYIIAGLIIGPLGFQLISDSNAILSLAELGVAFLLFAVGMEIDFSKLAQYKKPILIGGFLQVAITSVIVSLALRFFALPFLESVYVGLIVAFSSSVIAVKLLTDSRQLNSLEGKLIIGYALVQDLLAVVLMPLLAHPESVFSPGALVMLLASFVVLVLTGYILGKFVFPRVTTEAAKSQEVFFLTMVSSCFLFIFLSKSLGFPLAVGAFIGGLALGRIPFNLEAQNSVHYLRDLFGTVFFVALGLQLKTLVLGPLFWVLLAVVFVLNPLVFLGINLLLGFGLQTGLAVGLTLFQASEFSFILAGQGLELGQISAATFNAAVWVILLSMIATPYMARLQRPIHSFLLSRFSGIKKHLRFFERSLSDLQRVPKDELLFDHIIVAGAGVFGRQIVDSLADSQKVLVLEQDPDVVRRMVNQKVPAVYSSRNNLSVLEKVGLHRAKMLVVTIPDHPTALSYVRAGREANRKLVIFCRAHTPTDALDLYAAGANLVILPQVMASNYCLQQIQQTLTTGRVPHGGFEREWLRVLSDPGFEK